MVRTWIENSGLSSRSKARRNAGSPIRATHRGQRSPDPTRVRFAPKATVSDPDATSRDGPSTEVGNYPAFSVCRELRGTNSGFINGLDRQNELELRSIFSI